MSPKTLAARWNRSPRTLNQWRWLGVGPRYLKMGSLGSFSGKGEILP